MSSPSELREVAQQLEVAFRDRVFVLREYADLIEAECNLYRKEAEHLLSGTDAPAPQETATWNARRQRICRADQLSVNTLVSALERYWLAVSSGAYP